MTPQSTFTRRSLYHGWLPANPAVHRAFLQKHIHQVLRHPVSNTTGNADWAAEFIDTIKNSATMKPLMDLVFRQVNKDEKWAASDDRFRVRDIDHLQQALTSVLQGPPEVIVVTNDQGQKIGEPIGVPIYLILDLLSNTGAAYDLFRLGEFNDAMRTLLNHWGTYLINDSTSNSTLTQEDNGWFSPSALQVLESGLQGKTFEQTYGVNPADAQANYLSWDAFFARSFSDISSVRPIVQVLHYPAIYNACESTSLRTVHNVKLDDTFWLKGQNYSLYDMFGGSNPDNLSSYADRFVGGSAYQAFLSPQDYHRYHSPIKGTILEAKVLPGTYYAVLPDDGAPADDADLQPGDPHGAMIRSQPWLSVAAARGIVIIQPESSSPMELVAFIAIGMVEVSSVEFNISKEGTGGKPNSVDVGDQLGMFHFGGSTHVLVVKPKEGKQVVFKDLNDYDITPGQHRWVRSIVGRVVDQ